MSETINLGQSATTASETELRAFAMGATRPSRALSSPRHGSQAYFWTNEWQQSERLADLDLLIGGEYAYRPTDVEDLIRELHS